MDLKVIEPIDKPVQEFKTTDEFNVFYQKNKDMIDKITTHKLNKMYKIDGGGYKITKITDKKTGEKNLSLKRWTKNYYMKKGDAEKEAGASSMEERFAYQETINESNNEELENLDERCKRLEDKLKAFEKKLAIPIEDERIPKLMHKVEGMQQGINELIEGLRKSGLIEEIREERTPIIPRPSLLERRRLPLTDLD
jgi:hypothetical protein